MVSDADSYFAIVGEVGFHYQKLAKGVTGVNAYVLFMFCFVWRDEF